MDKQGSDRTLFHDPYNLPNHRRAQKSPTVNKKQAQATFSHYSYALHQDKVARACTIHNAVLRLDLLGRPSIKRPLLFYINYFSTQTALVSPCVCILSCFPPYRIFPGFSARDSAALCATALVVFFERLNLLLFLVFVFGYNAVSLFSSKKTNTRKSPFYYLFR